MRVQLLVALSVVGLLTSQGSLCDVLCAAQPEPMAPHSLMSGTEPEPCHQTVERARENEADPDCSEDCPTCTGQNSFLRSATDQAGSCHIGIQVAALATLRANPVEDRSRPCPGRLFIPPPGRTPLLKSSLLL